MLICELLCLTGVIVDDLPGNPALIFPLREAHRWLWELELIQHSTTQVLSSIGSMCFALTGLNGTFESIHTHIHTYIIYIKIFFADPGPGLLLCGISFLTSFMTW